MICADCRTPLPYSGRGRPRVRCQDCQAKRRRAYIAAKVREHRAQA